MVLARQAFLGPPQISEWGTEILTALPPVSDEVQIKGAVALLPILGSRLVASKISK